MRTLVMKFGGTSTGSIEALNRAAEIVIAQNKAGDRLVVVVSAMAGITDMLIDCAERAQSKDKGSFQIIIDELHHKLSDVVRVDLTGEQYHAELMRLIEARLAELTKICDHIHKRGNVSPQQLDEIAALGERINVHVFSVVLRRRGIACQPVDAAELIITDDCFQAASPLRAATDARVKAILFPLFAKATIPVVTGYIGATAYGVTTTLGRGGSDYTAAILAQSLNADEVWFWTDVDGVMTADPNLIPGARLIPEISYTEVFQLACYGAKVLHPKTILPAMQGDIPLWIKNTFNPRCKGTLISQHPSSGKYQVAAVAGLFNISLIALRIRLEENINSSKTLIKEAFTRKGLSPMAVFQAQHDRELYFAFSTNNLYCAIQAIEGDKTLDLHDRELLQPKVTEGLALITLVGQGISKVNQVLSLVSSTLDQAGIRINLIGNGTSPHSLFIAVDNEQGAHAMQHIHDHMILNEALPYPNPKPLYTHLPAI
jgi:aspartate kinase